MAFDLNPVAVTSAALLRAIAAGGWTSRSELARAADRHPNNISRDLDRLHRDGLVTGDDLPVLTDAGRAQLDAIDRAESGDRIAPDGLPDGVEALRHAEILPDPDNARRDWDSDDAVADLQALAADIRQNGLLQNLVVRRNPDALDAAEFILVGGERRWRAIGRLIQSGDWPADRLIPARRLTTDDVGVRLAALAENLQRRALNPIEEANAYRGLREVGLSTEAIAERVAMTQRHVQARLQLLELTEDQQRRMTLPADDANRLSVSEARKLVANLEAKAKARAKAEAELSPRARLIFAEVRLANPGWYVNVPVDAIAMDADPDAVALNQAGYLKIPTTVDLDGVANARIESGGFDLITTLFGDTGLDSNRAYAAALRDELGLPQPEEGTWSTPWLNPPFELPADVVADLEARRAERAKESAEWEARQEAAAVEARKRAEAFALTRVHAEAALAKAAHAPAAPIVDDAPLMAERLGRRLPWAATDKGAVLDADGERIFTFVEMYRGATDREVALAMLAVASVNAAAGLATPPLVVSQADQAIDGSDPDAGDDEDLDDEDGDE